MVEPISAEDELQLSSCEEKTKPFDGRDMCLSVMSHEIRTSLNAVIGMTALLLAKDPKKSQIKELNTLKFCGENLMNIVNENLDFSKHKTEKVEIERSPLNLCALAGDIIALLQTGANEKGNSLKLFYDDTLPQHLLGDKTKLYQILVNLLSNAIKFTKNGKIVLAISFFEKIDDEIYIRFEIRDTGIGIPKDKHTCIFKPFTQANADTYRKYGGTGLGLSITKDLLALHQSEIKLDSKVGKGSTFSFTIAFKTASASNCMPTQEPLRTQFLGKRILIVDDNEINILVAKQFLNNRGMIIDVAVDGREAIAKVAEKRYDLVFMDIQMPVLNGFEAVRIIRQNNGAYFKNLPIVALTASTMPYDYQKFKEFGLNDYLLMPFKVKEIEVVLSNFFNTSQLPSRN